MSQQRNESIIYQEEEKFYSEINQKIHENRGYMQSKQRNKESHLPRQCTYYTR